MNEIVTVPESTITESAQRRLDVAIESAFGGVMSHSEDSMESQFIPLVEYRVGDDEKRLNWQILRFRNCFDRLRNWRKHKQKKRKPD